MGILRGKGWPIVKYNDSLLWAVQKWLNWLRCHLGYGLEWLWVQWSILGRILAPLCKYDWTAHVRRQCVKLLSPLVVFYCSIAATHRTVLVFKLFLSCCDLCRHSYVLHLHLVAFSHCVWKSLRWWLVNVLHLASLSYNSQLLEIMSVLGDRMFVYFLYNRACISYHVKWTVKLWRTVCFSSAFIVIITRSPCELRSHWPLATFLANCANSCGMLDLPHTGPTHPLSPFHPLSIHFLIFYSFLLSLFLFLFTVSVFFFCPSRPFLPLHFQAGGRRKRLNLGLVFCVYFVLSVLLS